MIRFENLKIYNFYDAIRGMRNSWESWGKMDSQEEPFVMGTEDFKLAMKLSKAGSDHGKYLRQILVSVDIIAPEYWFKEFDTYKVGTVANSTSMMHKLGSRELELGDFSFDNPDSPYVQEYLALINKVRDEWIASGKKKPSPTWREMNQLMAIAFNYRRTVTMNYQVLKSLYHSRKNHRLNEWHVLADWVETLPYSELITLKEEK